MVSTGKSKGHLISSLFVLVAPLSMNQTNFRR